MLSFLSYVCFKGIKTFSRKSFFSLPINAVGYQKHICSEKNKYRHFKIFKTIFFGVCFFRLHLNKGAGYNVQKIKIKFFCYISKQHSIFLMKTESRAWDLFLA